MENEQKLGIKVFYYYLYQKIVIGIILLIASFVVLSFKANITSIFNSVFSHNTSLSITNYIIITFFIVSFITIVSEILTSWISYIRIIFTLDENSITIKSGIFNKKEISIPYRQIQDVTITQKVSQRMMGVSSLVILTAGHDNNDKEGEAEGMFEVIDSEIAQKMRVTILERSNVTSRI